jgi:hypothetical protein
VYGVLSPGPAFVLGCLFRGAKEAYEPIYVLGREQAESEPIRVTEYAAGGMFYRILAGHGMRTRGASDVRSFQQKHVHVSRWRAEQSLDRSLLAAVGAEVAAVEEASALGFDNHGVCVECGVVNEVRRDRERSKLERSFVLEFGLQPKIGADGGEECSLAQDPRCRSARVDRHVSADTADEAVMVGMELRRVPVSSGKNSERRHGQSLSFRRHPSGTRSTLLGRRALGRRSMRLAVAHERSRF